MRRSGTGPKNLLNLIIEPDAELSIRSGVDLPVWNDQELPASGSQQTITKSSRTENVLRFIHGSKVRWSINFNGQAFRNKSQVDRMAATIIKIFLLPNTEACRK